MSTSNLPDNHSPLLAGNTAGEPAPVLPAAGMLNYQLATETAGFAAARGRVIAGCVLWIIASLPLLGIGGLIFLQMVFAARYNVSFAVYIHGALFSILFMATGIGCICMGVGSIIRKPWAANGGSALAMVLLTASLFFAACILTLLMNFQYRSYLGVWPVIILAFPLLVSGFLCYIHLRPSTAGYILSRTSRPSVPGKNTVLSLYLTVCDGLACLMSFWMLNLISDAFSTDAYSSMRLELITLVMGLALMLSTFLRWRFAWALAITFYGMWIWQILADIHAEFKEIAPHYLILFAGLMVAHFWLNRSRAADTLAPVMQFVPAVDPPMNQVIPMASLSPSAGQSLADKRTMPDNSNPSNRD